MSDHLRPVLLVEDDPDDEELTLRGFDRMNVKNPIDVARDGQEAIDYLFARRDDAAADLPVVVLLDLKLPRIGALRFSSGSVPSNAPAGCRW